MRGLLRLALLSAALPAAASLPSLESKLGPRASESHQVPYLQARSWFEARVDLREPGEHAILRHLEEVESSLRAHPPAGLSAARQAARARRLDDLRAYRTRGEFPRNLDFPDRLIPYFIDARGVACAVGQLIIASGDRDLAEDIARSQNNAYLPDIQDGRLVAWAHDNGLTLEECARIQPSYAPNFSDVVGLSFDSRNRPWVAVGNGGISGWGYILSRRGTDGWISQPNIYPYGYLQHCMVGERPLVVMGASISWNGAAPAAPEGGAMGGGTCAATPDGKGFWLGGDQGLRRYSVEDTGAPRLVETVRAGSDALPGDTVTRLTVVGNSIWVGTTKDVTSRTAGGAWSRHSIGDVAGGLLAGLKAGGGKGVWLGNLRAPNPWKKMGYDPFSEAGLVWQDGGGAATRYHRGNSPLPSDTIRLAAPAPDNSIWLTCDNKTLLRFTPPDSLSTLPFALPTGVSSLETDVVGCLHIGTYAPGLGGSSAKGIYRLEGESLVWLGHPSPPSSIARSSRGDRRPAEGLRPSLTSRDQGIAGLDALGRRAERVSAGGMYRILR